ncbi:MAG: MBL fold metallo-hydrolase, partial [Candidatus Coatesbacteria bacterium]
MLPARHGDCIWIEYGDPQKPSRLLIDGGTAGTYKAIRKRLKALETDERHFELLIVTHIDIDHINGILKLLGDQKVKVSFNDIWFNGWRHLTGSDLEEMGPVEGEKLTTFFFDNTDVPWNYAFVERGKRGVFI